MNIGSLLNVLESRLPELEWRMGSLNSSTFSEKSLPKGLFRPCIDPSPAFFVDEIRADINTLANQESQTCAHFLAKRIQYKINVLIALCKTTYTEVQPHTTSKLDGIRGVITTRKNHIEMLEKEIAQFEAQKKSMEETSTSLQQKNQVEALLCIQRELGELEKKQTLVKEELRRVMGK